MAGISKLLFVCTQLGIRELQPWQCGQQGIQTGQGTWTKLGHQCRLPGRTGQTMQIERPPCLRPGTGLALATNWLDAHDRPDNIAINIDIAGMNPRYHILNRLVYPAVQAMGQSVATGVDFIENLIQLLGRKAPDMQHRSEYLPLQHGQ